MRSCCPRASSDRRRRHQMGERDIPACGVPCPLKRSELERISTDEARVNHAVFASETASIPTGAL